MKVSKKAEAVARDWIKPHLYGAIFDCSDSAEEANNLEQRFLALVDDRVTIQEYVTRNLRDEYLRYIKGVLSENGDEDNDLSQTAMELLIYPDKET